MCQPVCEYMGGGGGGGRGLLTSYVQSKHLKPRNTNITACMHMHTHACMHEMVTRNHLHTCHVF